jgi:hypothetical protein
VTFINPLFRYVNSEDDKLLTIVQAALFIKLSGSTRITKWMNELMDERVDERIRNKIVYSLIIIRIKPKSAYEDVIIYYTINVLSPLEVTATYCSHPQDVFFRRICYKEHRNQITNIKYYVLSVRFQIYIKIYSTDKIICAKWIEWGVFNSTTLLGWWYDIHSTWRPSFAQFSTNHSSVLYILNLKLTT